MGNISDISAPDGANGNVGRVARASMFRSSACWGTRGPLEASNNVALVTPAFRGCAPTCERSSKKGTSREGKKGLRGMDGCDAGARSIIKYARGETYTRKDIEGIVRYGSGRA